MKTNIKVAGTTFHPLPAGSSIAITEELQVDNIPCAITDAVLRSEPENQYDPEAVAVYIKLGDGSAFHLGYLPKAEPLKAKVNASPNGIVLAKILIKDYGQIGNYSPSFVISEVNI